MNRGRSRSRRKFGCNKLSTDAPSSLSSGGILCSEWSRAVSLSSPNGAWSALSDTEIARYVTGLTLADAQEFSELADAAFLGREGPGSMAETALSVFVRDLYIERRSIGNSVSTLDRWAQDPSLSRDDAYGLYISLIVGSYHNLVRAIAQTVRRLGLGQRFTGRSSVNFVTETLRIDPSLTLLHRRATRRVKIDDLQVDRGEYVELSLVAANVDPAVFEDPARFTLNRKTRPITFGISTHQCAGLSQALRLCDMVARITHASYEVELIGDCQRANPPASSPGAINSQLARIFRRG